MQRLIEATVQDIAQKHLEKRYKPKAKKGKLFSKIEVRTKKEKGGKRADGLLAFKRWLLGVYVVSMEAKSYKTLPAMKPYRDDRLWLLNSLWAGLLVCIFTGGFYALFKMSDGMWQFLIPLNMFILGVVLYGYFTRKSYRHKVVDVVNQVGQYPANEQWLAFSMDSLASISLNKRKNLETICRFRGIGILIVHNKSRVEELVQPKMRFKWRKDFLVDYSIESEIRQKIA